MTRRDDIAFALAILTWAFLIPTLAFLVYLYAHGFDSDLCDAYRQCGWRHA